MMENLQSRKIWLKAEIKRLADLPVRNDIVDDRINDLEQELEELEKELGK